MSLISNEPSKVSYVDFGKEHHKIILVRHYANVNIIVQPLKIFFKNQSLG